MAVDYIYWSKWTFIRIFHFYIKLHIALCACVDKSYSLNVCILLPFLPSFISSIPLPFLSIDTYLVPPKCQLSAPRKKKNFFVRHGLFLHWELWQSSGGYICMEKRYNALLKIDLQTLISYFLILVLLQKRKIVPWSKTLTFYSSCVVELYILVIK